MTNEKEYNTGLREGIQEIKYPSTGLIKHSYENVCMPAYWCLTKMLKMKNFWIEFDFRKILKSEMGYNAWGLYYPPHEIVIDVDEIRNHKEVKRWWDDPYTFFVQTMFHELRHYYQYQTKMYESPRILKLRNDPKVRSSGRKSDSLPTERDAKRFSNKALALWLKEREW